MATHALPASHVIDNATAADTPPRKRPMFVRLYRAVLESQMYRARREIEQRLGPDALSRIARATSLPER